MAKPSTEKTVRPRATGDNLRAAIDQARKDFDAIATLRLRKDGQWRHGPLIWQTLLEVSLETAFTGSAPEISKHQLTVALKRRFGLDLEVDAEVWKRFQSFHENQVMSRLRLAAAATELPALAAERVTPNGGRGGAPHKSQAVFWLCLDTDRQSEEQKPSDTHRKAPGGQSMPDAATEMSTPIGHGTMATEVPSEPESEAYGILQAPAVGTEEKAAVQATSDLGALASWPQASSSSNLLWLVTPRPRAVRSSSTLVTAVLSVALVIPVFSQATADFLQPVQALADSISALVDVLSGSTTVRT